MHEYLCAPFPASVADILDADQRLAETFPPSKKEDTSVVQSCMEMTARNSLNSHLGANLLSGDVAAKPTSHWQRHHFCQAVSDLSCLRNINIR